MNDYEKVLKALSISRTLRAHATKLSEIAANSNDLTLKQFILEDVLRFLHRGINTRLPKGLKVPSVVLLHASAEEIVELVRYAKEKLATQRPSWYDEAIEDGWTPPPGKYT